MMPEMTAAIRRMPLAAATVLRSPFTTASGKSGAWDDPNACADTRAPIGTVQSDVIVTRDGGQHGVDSDIATMGYAYPIAVKLP